MLSADSVFDKLWQQKLIDKTKIRYKNNKHNAFTSGKIDKSTPICYTHINQR